MNTYQACLRIKSILKSLRWGGSGDNVFGRDSVKVTVAAAQEYVDQLNLPAAFIWPGGGTADAERPDLFERTIWVRVIVSIPGDQVGERPLLGGGRISATGHGGRGLLEIETALLGAIEQLDASQQFRIGAQYVSPTQAQADETGYHCWADYGFKATLTSGTQHTAPRSAAASEAAGTVTVSWTAPDDTTNLVAYVVRRTAGTIPVAYPTDGTDVAWTAGLNVTDAPGSGTYTYSVFATYDDLGGSVEHDFSDYSAVTITF